MEYGLPSKPNEINFQFEIYCISPSFFTLSSEIIENKNKFFKKKKKELSKKPSRKFNVIFFLMPRTIAISAMELMVNDRPSGLSRQEAKYIKSQYIA